MTVVRIKWTRQHKTLCMVSSTWQTSVSGNDFCNRQSIIMPLFTRFSNMGFSGLWGYNDTPSGNSELRMPPENTLNYSRHIAASFRESRAGGERQARREGEKEKQSTQEREKERGSCSNVSAFREEGILNKLTLQRGAATNSGQNKTTAWGLWSLSRSRQIWGKLNKHPTWNVSVLW